jgi:hypothetical protein
LKELYESSFLGVSGEYQASRMSSAHQLSPRYTMGVRQLYAAFTNLPLIRVPAYTVVPLSLAMACKYSMRSMSGGWE